ncbi:hypothetical protein [Deinococcus planocerae]|uniref:hypothetical protein n=1 Tax=Deinococcus planocerae TaxID=1737569 RepID=UPI000C7F2F44|nr:hypothetical protein [Deinococcus planocerae]
MTLFLASLLAVSGFAAIHLPSPALRVLAGVPRNRLLSAAGGLAVAFIFLRILPEFGDSQQVFRATPRGTLLGLLGNHVYVIALVSLVLFYAVSGWFKPHGRSSGRLATTRPASASSGCTSPPTRWTTS